MNRKALTSWLLTGWLMSLFLLSGCSSVTMQTVKDPSASIKLKRLYVCVNNTEENGQVYSADFADSLKTALTNDPVEIKIITRGPLELDENPPLKDIKAFAPDAVLTVTATGGLVSPYGGYPTLTYDASLWATDLEHRLWRAQIKNSGGTAIIHKRMREMAEQIVVELRQSGFL